jgi:hypothetical protein
MDTRGLSGGDSDSSEDEDSPGKAPSMEELDRTASERNGFMFRHNLGGSVRNLREFHPLPSQVPFLLSTYSENVNLFTQIVHMPTVTKMSRKQRGPDMSTLTLAEEALLFSMYYAAVTSMEDDDVSASRRLISVLGLQLTLCYVFR